MSFSYLQTKYCWHLIMTWQVYIYFTQMIIYDTIWHYMTLYDDRGRWRGVEWITKNNSISCVKLYQNFYNKVSSVSLVRDKSLCRSQTTPYMKIVHLYVMEETYVNCVSYAYGASCEWKTWSFLKCICINPSSYSWTRKIVKNRIVLKR